MIFLEVHSAGFLDGDTLSLMVVIFYCRALKQTHPCYIHVLFKHDSTACHVYWQSSLKCVFTLSVHSPDTLKEAPVPIISTKKCNSSCMYNGEITSRMLCAGYTEGKVDACQVRRMRLNTALQRCLKGSFCLVCDLFVFRKCVYLSPGRQWRSSGVPGWKRVEAGRCCQLGYGLCWT